MLSTQPKDGGVVSQTLTNISIRIDLHNIDSKSESIKGRGVINSNIKQDMIFQCAYAPTIFSVEKNAKLISISGKPLNNDSNSSEAAYYKLGALFSYRWGKDTATVRSVITETLEKKLEGKNLENIFGLFADSGPEIAADHLYTIGVEGNVFQQKHKVFNYNPEAFGNTVVYGRHSYGKTSLLKSVILSAIYRQENPFDIKIYIVTDTPAEYDEFENCPYVRDIVDDDKIEYFLLHIENEVKKRRENSDRRPILYLFDGMA